MAKTKTKQAKAAAPAIGKAKVAAPAIGKAQAAAPAIGKAQTAPAVGEAQTAAAGEAQECGCRHKATPRSEQLQADLQKRLNRAIGQLNGVKRMIDENRYCGDVLTQLAAAESAVRRISDMVLKEHLETCVSERIKAGDESAIDEVMDLLRQHNG